MRNDKITGFTGGFALSVCLLAPSADAQNATAKCHDIAGRVAGAISGTVTSQTMSVVGIDAPNQFPPRMFEAKLMCPSIGDLFHPKRVGISLFWNSASPPPRFWDLAGTTGEVITRESAAVVSETARKCVSQVLGDGGEISWIDAGNVRVECQAFARDGGANTITIYRVDGWQD
jgi:hypothetical protein